MLSLESYCHGDSDHPRLCHCLLLRCSCKFSMWMERCAMSLLGTLHYTPSNVFLLKKYQTYFALNRSPVHALQGANTFFVGSVVIWCHMLLNLPSYVFVIQNQGKTLIESENILILQICLRKLEKRRTVSKSHTLARPTCQDAVVIINAVSCHNRWIWLASRVWSIPYWHCACFKASRDFCHTILFCPCRLIIICFVVFLYNLNYQ